MGRLRCPESVVLVGSHTQSASSGGTSCVRFALTQQCPLGHSLNRRSGAQRCTKAGNGSSGLIVLPSQMNRTYPGGPIGDP